MARKLIRRIESMRYHRNGSGNGPGFYAVHFHTFDKQSLHAVMVEVDGAGTRPGTSVHVYVIDAANPNNRFDGEAFVREILAAVQAEWDKPCLASGERVTSKTCQLFIH